MADIVPKSNGKITNLGPFNLTSVGLEASGKVSFDDWEKAGHYLQLAAGSVQWWVGDWMILGEGSFGEMAAQAYGAAGLEYGAVANMKWVASRFDVSRRREILTFGHHQVVASLDPEFADHLLDRAEQEKLSVRDLKSLISELRRKRERDALAAEAAKSGTPGEDLNVVHADFRQVAEDIPDASVNLIFTDPPYHREYLPLYGDLAEVAARVLKPGGSLICYLGQYQIGEVCNLITPHLRLWWTLCCLHSGRSARMTEYGIVVKWKPMLWFVKDTRGDKFTFVDDLILSREEKDHHDWQQSESEAAYYVENLCPPSGLVFDPFCGGGTTAAVAKRLGRRWLTCDVDESSVHLARKRVRDVSP